MPKYHILLERDNAASPWRVEFGDKDRDLVVYERQTYRDSGIRASNLKIICSNSARQSCIAYCVDYLNRGGLFIDGMPRHKISN